MTLEEAAKLVQDVVCQLATQGFEITGDDLYNEICVSSKAEVYPHAIVSADNGAIEFCQRPNAPAFRNARPEWTKEEIESISKYGLNRVFFAEPGAQL